MSPFMTFYTPTYKRPTYLSVCRQSVQAQTCRDFQHMVIVDDSGIGIDGMFADIRRHVKDMRGEYVYILADDDRLLGRDGLARVKMFATANGNPEVIIVRNYKWGREFPLDWPSPSPQSPKSGDLRPSPGGRGSIEPVLTRIDTGNFIIRRDVFAETAELFGERYEGDFDYIHALWERGYPFYWCDCVFSEMQIGGKGRTEAEIMASGQTIKVRALKGFVATIGDQAWRIKKGSEFWLPPMADWVRAGLCVVVEDLTPSPFPKGKGNDVSTETLKSSERAIGKGGRRHA